MSTAVQRSSRAGLARAWSDALRRTDYVPLSDDEFDHLVSGLLDHLVDALGQPTLSTRLAAEVGNQLVQHGFVGEQSLGATVEILGHGLPGLDGLRIVDGLTDKVISVLGALASGYATALRRWILDQQEDVKHALMRTREKAEREHRASEARFREVFDSAPLGIAISDATGPITDVNGSLAEIMDYPPAALTGRRIGELFHPDDMNGAAIAYQQLTDGKQPRFRSRVKLLAAGEDTIWASVAVSVLTDADGNPAQHVTMIENLSDKHLLQQQLCDQTLLDLLTELPNQAAFWIQLKAVIERAKPDTTVTLCKVDLDAFSVLSDSHGHEAGDLVLTSVARALERLVAGQQAMVARFGADEFAILIEGSPGGLDDAAFAASVNAELSEPVFLGSIGLSVSAGVGVVSGPVRGVTAAELVRRADVTLHQAKRTGRGQWALYDQPADVIQRARHTLATAMPGAWENGQVTLLYQPMVRIDPDAADAGRIVAVQTLLSWEQPDGTVVTHEDCLALAEQTGLVLSIGPWILQEACSQLRGWRDQLGPTVPPIRADLTTHLGMDPDLMAVLRRALGGAELTPPDVQLGMPLELVIGNRGDAVENLRTLRDAGACALFTNFGQGIGNLVTLDGEPVAAVDITPALVRMALRPDSMVRPALSTLVPLIRRTGTGVVVAGIDTAEQVDWWRGIGADSARGDAFAPPGTADEIGALLTR